MAYSQTYHTKGGPLRGQYRFSHGRNHANNHNATLAPNTYNNTKYFDYSFTHQGDFDHPNDIRKNFMEYGYSYNSNCVKPEVEPSAKRRKCLSSSWGSSASYHQQLHACNNVPPRQPSTHNHMHPRNQGAYDSVTSICNNNSSIAISTASTSNRSFSNGHASNNYKRGRSEFEDDDNEVVFMSREEIERCSPSRKDGIDAVREMHLRYSYCAFLQTLGARLELPQTTIGTAMVLCHRFFVRRSHACHDRFLVATAALFLAAKSEETPCPLNNVLRSASEIFHKQDFSYLSYALPVDWFELYRERITEAEQLILTTLNFELNVQHPYTSLTSTLEKLGFSQTVLVNLALNLVSEGVFRRIILVACMILLAGG